MQVSSKAFPLLFFKVKFFVCSALPVRQSVQTQNPPFVFWASPRAPLSPGSTPEIPALRHSPFFGRSSALPHNIGRKIKGAPPGTPFKIKNTPGSGCVRSLRLYLRTPSDLESRMTSDKIMRFMSTPPIRASLNFLPYQVYHTSLPVSRGIFLLRQNAGFMHPSSCALAPICGGAPCAGYISRIYKYVKSPLPRTVEKAHPGAFGAQIRLFRKKRKNNLTSADGGVIM